MPREAIAAAGDDFALRPVGTDPFKLGSWQSDQGVVLERDADCWLSTGVFGRDLLVRLVYGSQVSRMVGVVSVVTGAGLRGVLGALVGGFGSWGDHITMRVMDAVYSFSAVLPATALVSGPGTGIFNLMLAVGLVMVPSFACIVRSSVIQARAGEFVEARYRQSQPA
ncbi:MAG: ABC transporter permease subunit [Bacillota bacterium]